MAAGFVDSFFSWQQTLAANPILAITPVKLVECLRNVLQIVTSGWPTKKHASTHMRRETKTLFCVV